MGVLLGIDLGEKRVGTAICDERTSIATPLKTISFQGRKQLARELLQIVDEHHVTKVVVGLPRTLKGEIGISAQKVMECVEALKLEIDRPWEFWDERFSSQEVERVLLEADVSRAKRREVRDQLAAQRILQSYVDSQRKHTE